jgi:hypothetical protein
LKDFSACFGFEGGPPDEMPADRAKRARNHTRQRNIR